jgi:uncharacterized protein (TIGR02270 family)
MVKLGGVPIEEHLAEEVCFLRISRDNAVHAPNFRLIDLSRLDERLDACLDALRVAGERGWQAIASAFLDQKDPPPGLVFAGTCTAIANNISVRLEPMLERSGLTGPGGSNSTAFSEFVGALAFASRDNAAAAIERLRIRPEPLSRAACIAAIGARRADPGSVLLSALDSPFPFVRARACRTAGLVGRADLTPKLAAGLTEPDPDYRFWSAWALARMGAGEQSLGVLAEIAWKGQAHTTPALGLLLRRLETPHANAWLREFAKLPGRQRDLIRGIGAIGDPLYIPWLIERMAEPETARLAGEAFSLITGLDLAFRDLERRGPEDFQSGPGDDPADENVALDEDDTLPWPDPARVGDWWTANREQFRSGTSHFLGVPKAGADWLLALSDAFQRQRHAAALELAIRQPNRAMFEVRARGRLQRQSLTRARGLS